MEPRRTSNEDVAPMAMLNEKDALINSVEAFGDWFEWRLEQVATSILRMFAAMIAVNIITLAIILSIR